jgi:hypothetical protein
MSGPGRIGLVALAAALSAAPAAVAQTAAPERAERERFALVLDVAVGQVSQARTLPVLGTATVTRSYPVPGVGYFFVLPPQALPSERRVLLLRRSGAVPRPAPQADAELAPNAIESAGSDSDAVQRAEAAATREARRAAPRPRELDRELREVEELALAYQREVERMSRQAEDAMLRLTQALREGRQEIRIPVGPIVVEGAPAPPAAPPPPAAGAPVAAPAAPLPPWRYWFELADEPSLSAPSEPERLIGDVRAAVVEVMESQGPSLRALRPEEHVVVAVDFVPRAALAGVRDVPEPKTLVFRARKRDLDARRAGQLSAEELRQRIEVVEY